MYWKIKQMAKIELIVLARAIHVMAGVAWAGVTFTFASMIVPSAVRPNSEITAHPTTLIGRRVGPVFGISSLLTVLSGIYLFAALHPTDSSAGGLVLRAGALAALLSLVVGFLVGQPAGRRLAQLTSLAERNASTAAAGQDLAPLISRLRQRAALSARLTAGLLSIAVLSMAVFRYAQAL
jgi:uncharacterized membrane protein